jgi:hypothetical protein
VAVVLAAQDFAHPLLVQEFSTLVGVAAVPIQPHKILAALVVVGRVLVVLVLEPQVRLTQAAGVGALQDRAQQVAQAALES